MNKYYELTAIPRLFNVSCPKHKKYMVELRNGFFGEMLWGCEDCDRPYYLKPTMLKETEFDRQALQEQLNEANP